MRAYERLLKYVKIHTASAEGTDTVPSTARQFDLSRLLAEEMRALGMAEVYVDEHAYVYGAIPAAAGMEAAPSIGLIAHIDTVPDFSGENVKPQVIENYSGGDVPLGGERARAVARDVSGACLSCRADAHHDGRDDSPRRG